MDLPVKFTVLTTECIDAFRQCYQCAVLVKQCCSSLHSAKNTWRAAGCGHSSGKAHRFINIDFNSVLKMKTAVMNMRDGCSRGRGFAWTSSDWSFKCSGYRSSLISVSSAFTVIHNRYKQLSIWKICLFTFFPSIRWEDWYHPYICKVKI